MGLSVSIHIHFLPTWLFHGISIKLGAHRPRMWGSWKHTPTFSHLSSGMYGTSNCACLRLCACMLLRVKMHIVCLWVTYQSNWVRQKETLYYTYVKLIISKQGHDTVYSCLSYELWVCLWVSLCVTAFLFHTPLEHLCMIVFLCIFKHANKKSCTCQLGSRAGQTDWWLS